jgi:hypothetical protein
MRNYFLLFLVIFTQTTYSQLVKKLADSLTLTKGVSINAASLNHIRLANRFSIIGSTDLQITNNTYFDGVNYRYLTNGGSSKISITSAGKLFYSYAYYGAKDDIAIYHTMSITDTLGKLSVIGLIDADTANFGKGGAFGGKVNISRTFSVNSSGNEDGNHTLMGVTIGSNSTAQITGSNVALELFGAANLTGANGIDVNSTYSSVYNYNTGTIPWINGWTTDIRNMSSGTINNIAQIKMRNINNNGGTVGNQYGLWIDNLSSASTNYSIYSGTAPSYFNGNIGIKMLNPKRDLDVSGTTRTSDSVWVGNGIIYSWAKAGDAAFTVSSDTSLKSNIELFSDPNLSNFKHINPIKYRYKKELFLKTFNENCIPDSIPVTTYYKYKLPFINNYGQLIFINADSSATKMVSNAKAKDSLIIDFYYRNNLEAERKSKEEFVGFSAQQFNKELYNKESNIVDYNKVVASMWLKIIQLESMLDSTKLAIAILETKN